MSERIIKARVVLTVEVSLDDWQRENPGESVAHVRNFIRSNAVYAVRDSGRVVPKAWLRGAGVTLENATGREW